jgi:transcriptional regulator with XRE-family HTH domain
LDDKNRSFRDFLLLMQLDRPAIRRRIRSARKAAGLTQQELAELMRVHKRTVENWENEYVPWERLNELASVLAREVEWFLYGGDIIAAAKRDEAEAVVLAAVARLDERLDRIEAEIAELRDALPAPRKRPAAEAQR